MHTSLNGLLLDIREHMEWRMNVYVQGNITCWQPFGGGYVARRTAQGDDPVDVRSRSLRIHLSVSKLPTRRLHCRSTPSSHVTHNLCSLSNEVGKHATYAC